MLAPDSPLEECRGIRASMALTVAAAMSKADDPRVVADIVLKAATAVSPNVRYTAGGLAGRLRLLRRFAPAAMLDGGIRTDLHLDRPSAPVRLLSAN